MLSNSLGLSDEEILKTSQANSGIKPGSVVHDQIAAAMDSAESVIVLITPASGERPWVQFEAGGAFFRDKPLYVLIHPSANAPGTFSKKPVTIDRVDDVANLIDAIRDDFKVGHVCAKPLVDHPDDKSDRRTLFLVVLFAVEERYGVIEGAAKAPDVWRAYENLWNELSAVRPETVAVPSKHELSAIKII